MESSKRFSKGLIFFVTGIILLILSFYSLGFFGNGGSTQFRKEYKENIVPNNLYKYLSKQEVLEFLDKGTGIIYFGYPESPWSTRVVSILNEAAFANDIEKINYYNIKRERNTLALRNDGTVSIEANGTSFYNELLKELTGFTDKYILEDKDGKSVDTKEYRIYVPFVAFVKNGDVVYAHSDVVESYTDSSVELTQDQRDELYNIYEKGILLIKE